ncbi:MAG: MBL fold metallo-hydrolase [bacterium]
MEIAKGVYQVGGAGVSAGGDAAAYLVDGEKEAVLIDAGTGEATQRLVENISRTGVEPSRVGILVLTHCHVDHSGGALELKQKLGLSVACHKECGRILARGDDPRTAAEWYGIKLPPIRADVAFESEEYEIDLGDTSLTCIHVPGHSPGSICAVLDREGKRILFGQDVHGPIHPALESDWNQWQESLQRMIELEADVLCEGHFGIISPAHEVAKFIKSFQVA